MNRKRLTAIALVCLAAAALAHGQAVSTRFELPSIGGLRNTYQIIDVNDAPVWLASAPASFDTEQNQPTSIDLKLYCEDPDGVTPTITKNSGSLPTGMTLTAGVVAGTPTVVQSVAPVFRCADSAGLFDDHTLTFNIQAPPPAPNDGDPDQFSFLPVIDVPLSTQQNSAYVTISGINIPATVTVSGGSWSKNGGAYTQASGTVVAADTVSLRHTSSSIYATVKTTTLTIGTVVGSFSSTTIPAPPQVPRQGIIFTASAEALTPCTNNGACTFGSWPVPLDAAIDGIRVKQLGNPTYGASANVLSQQHFSVVSGCQTNGPCPVDGDGKFFKGTIYPENSPGACYDPPGSVPCTVFDYTIVGNGGKDKPRIDLLMHSAAEALHTARPTHNFAYRVDQRLCFALYLPSDYVEDTIAAGETVLQLPGESEPDNNLSMRIVGGAGGANWEVSRQVGAVGGIQGTEFYTKKTPVTDAMKGHWTYFMFLMNIDNRTTGATPKFEWVMQVEGQPAQVIDTDNTSRWGFDATGDPNGWGLNQNLVYKGSWHGETSPGTYTGNKTQPITLYMDALRVGDDTAGYSDCHPTREAHP